MKLKLFGYVSSILLLSLGVIGTTTTIVGSDSLIQAWADAFEGTEGFDVIEGTPEDDVIDSKGGIDFNAGDTDEGDGSGDDVINSGEGSDTNTGNGGADIFACGDGEEGTVTDYNEAEGDIATPDCENI